MKLMKHITIALVLSAIPAMAFGQVGAIDAAMVDILCPATECHTATYFQGSGGFVGMATPDIEATAMVDESEVAFIVSCGNVTTRAVAEKDDMGVVRQVFNEENGLACAAGGKIDIHRLMPGGWYWINDDVNSAVASLMPKTVLGKAQPRVDPFDPGGLTVSPGDNATYVKHEATGRVGILQHIQPVPPITGCKGGAAAASSCVLGAASDWGLTAAAPLGIRSAMVNVAGATIKRPAEAVDAYNVTVTLVGKNFVLIGDAPATVATLSGAFLGGTNFAPTPAGVTLADGGRPAGRRPWACGPGRSDRSRRRPLR